MRTTIITSCLMLTIAAVLTGCDNTPDNTQKQALNPDLPNFAVYQDVKEKKKAFFSFLKPLIQQANAAVLAERQQVLKWQESGHIDEQQLTQLLDKYRVKATDPEAQQATLLNRIHTIPPSLVMAQAANESAWGTSRFAREGNNLFGQWCFSKGCGLVPSSRNSGANHEVAKFSSPAKSVASYIRNLNSHPSYKELRALRRQELSNKKHSTGMTLAEGLLKYSERGEEYVEEIRAMIRHNKLARYDSGIKIDAGQQPQQNQG